MHRSLIHLAAWWRYGAALVLFAVALGVGRVAFAAVSGLPFIILFPAIVLVTAFCGLGPAILGLLLSGAVLADKFNGSSGPTLIAFFASASLVCGVVDRMRRARADAMAALREAMAGAERANLAKSKFLATASHDLRQPVQSLVLFLDLMKSRATAELERPLYFMEQAVTALNIMLNGILDISRLDAGVLSPTNEVFDAGAVLRRLGDEYAADAALRSLRLRIHAPSMGVLADIVLVERILRNLIDNALRYTEAGGLVIGCRRHGDEVRIDVVDSGVGIAEEHLSSVFDEYYQVDNDARDRAKGLGLGLAIVDRLVALVGGRLELRSRLGHGSRFSVFLPAVALPPTASAGPTADVDGKLVLVIEDEEMVRMSLRAMMESWGFHVVDAADLASALRLAVDLDRRPDAILADYRLRDGHTGVDAARQIRAALGADIPTMVLTGDTAGEPIHQVQASGFGILHKPVPAEALRAAVTRLLPRGLSR